MAISLPIVSKFDDKGVNDAQSGLDRLSGFAKGAGAALAAGFAVAGAAAVAFGAASLRAAAEAESVTRGLENAAKNAGVFGDTAASIDLATEALDKHSTQLAELTGIDDEIINQIKTGWLAVPSLAAMGVDGLNNLATVVADTAAGTGKDVQAIGLAFQRVAGDTESAFSKLTRAGIVFTDDQKATFDSILETNGEMAAQGYLIEQLGDKYQGAAEAAANPFDRLNVIFENLKETVGAALLPAIEKIVPLVADFVSKLVATPEFEAFLVGLSEAFLQLVEALMPLLPTITDLILSLMPPLIEVIKQLAPFVIDLVEAFMPLIPLFADMVEQLLPPLVELLTNFVKLFTDNPEFMASTIQGFKDFHKVIEPVAGLLQIIADFLGQIGQKKTALDGLEARVRSTQKAASIGVGTASPYLSYNGNWGQAAGGQMTQGGLSWVGERGPELLNLPTGAQVIPLGKIPTGGSNNSFVINVNAGMGADGAALGEQIVTAIRKYERTSGAVFAKA